MLDRTDYIVAGLFVVVAAATVGMIADIWWLAYYAIPLLAYLFILMGSLSHDDRWSARHVIASSAFGALLLGLFLWAGLSLGSDTVVGGLPLATAVMLFGIWPLITVVTPLLYAWVHETWLASDVDTV